MISKGSLVRVKPDPDPKATVGIPLDLVGRIGEVIRVSTHGEAYTVRFGPGEGETEGFWLSELEVVYET